MGERRENYYSDSPHEVIELSRSAQMHCCLVVLSLSLIFVNVNYAFESLYSEFLCLCEYV